MISKAISSQTAKRSLFTIALAATLTSIAVWCVGENPFHVFKILAESAAGSFENLSYTLFYATPMLLTGTAVAVALEAGLFNIGAEGQLYFGAVFAASWGALTRSWFPDSQSTLSLLGLIVILGGVAAAFCGGALWGALAGYLRAKRGVHEVIATIMLNFVAFAFSNWMVLNVLKNPNTQSSETVWIAKSLRISHLFYHSTWGLPIAVLLVCLVLFALKRTWWGFRVRATGKNEVAASLAGINVDRTALATMAVSGGIAGLVGFHEVFLNAYRMIDSFSPGYGFTGMAIALLARGNPAALIAAALFFGALHKGALDLDIETDRVSRDLSAVIQALILVSLAATTRKGTKGSK
jgi:simple sugar transport system permease protein